METKARYFLVGSCAIMALVLFAAFLIFSSHEKEQTSLYAVYFTGGVRGLSTGNSVLFNGVPVGNVKDFYLVEQDQSQVRVVLEISSKVVIRQDCEASLDTQGITGMSGIYIRGGSAKSPPLDPAHDDHDDPLPVIPSGKSTLESLAGGFPELIASATLLMNRMSEAFSEENQQNLRVTMQSMAKVSSALAAEGGRLQTALVNLDEAGQKLNALLDDSDRLITGEGREALLAMRRTLDRINSLVTKLEPELLRLSSSGAQGVDHLVKDARSLMRDLDKLVRDLNNNPRGLLFGNTVPEYQPR